MKISLGDHNLRKNQYTAVFSAPQPQCARFTDSSCIDTAGADLHWKAIQVSVEDGTKWCRITVMWLILQFLHFQKPSHIVANEAVSVRWKFPLIRSNTPICARHRHGAVLCWHCSASLTTFRVRIFPRKATCSVNLCRVMPFSGGRRVLWWYRCWFFFPCSRSVQMPEL